MSFQGTAPNRDLPLGVDGDFASTNPRATMLAGEGSLRTAEIITVGAFAFADVDTGKVYAAHAAGRRVGFVHRGLQGSVSMSENASMTVPAGRGISLFTTGDFRVTFTADVNAGDKVYALDADGSLVTDSTDAQETSYIVARSASAGESTVITVLG